MLNKFFLKSLRFILTSNKGSFLILPIIISGALSVSLLVSQLLIQTAAARFQSIRIKTMMSLLESQIKGIATQQNVYQNCGNLTNFNDCQINDAFFAFLSATSVPGTVCQQGTGPSATTVPCQIIIQWLDAPAFPPTGANCPNGPGCLHFVDYWKRVGPPALAANPVPIAGVIRNKFSARIRYTGSDYPIKDINLDFDIPQSVLFSTNFIYPVTAPVFRGFDANGLPQCRALVGDCSAPGSYISNVDPGTYNISCATLPSVICSNLEYISTYSWSVATGLNFTCQNRQSGTIFGYPAAPPALAGAFVHLPFVPSPIQTCTCPCPPACSGFDLIPNSLNFTNNDASVKPVSFAATPAGCFWTRACPWPTGGYSASSGSAWINSNIAFGGNCVNGTSVNISVQNNMGAARSGALNINSGALGLTRSVAINQQATAATPTVTATPTPTPTPVITPPPVHPCFTKEQTYAYTTCKLTPALYTEADIINIYNGKVYPDSLHKFCSDTFGAGYCFGAHSAVEPSPYNVYASAQDNAIFSRVKNAILTHGSVPQCTANNYCSNRDTCTPLVTANVASYWGGPLGDGSPVFREYIWIAMFSLHNVATSSAGAGYHFLNIDSNHIATPERAPYISWNTMCNGSGESPGPHWPGGAALGRFPILCCQ